MFRAFTTATILALTVTAARAASSDIEVPFGDLDLSKPSDATILQDRIQQAASRVCDQLLWTYTASPTFYRSWFNSCVGATSAQTTRRVEARAGQYSTFARN